VKTLSAKVEDDLNDISAKFNAVKGSCKVRRRTRSNAVQACLCRSARPAPRCSRRDHSAQPAYGTIDAEEAAYNNVTLRSAMATTTVST